MNAPAAPPSLSESIGDEALSVFARSHVNIVERMQQLGELPERLARAGLNDENRACAAGLYRFFNDAVLDHHDEEERELFPAMRHSATPGDEAGLVDSLVTRLEREHRELEALWDRIEPALRRLGRGKPAELDAAVVKELVERYRAHARFEESAVLPLAERRLKSGDRAALALALAMRRTPVRFAGYI
jgi:hemerythrin-like domain-containing protein